MDFRAGLARLLVSEDTFNDCLVSETGLYVDGKPTFYMWCDAAFTFIKIQVNRGRLETYSVELAEEGSFTIQSLDLIFDEDSTTLAKIRSTLDAIRVDYHAALW